MREPEVAGECVLVLVCAGRSEAGGAGKGTTCKLPALHRTVMANKLGFERNDGHRDGLEEGMQGQNQKLTLGFLV